MHRSRLIASVLVVASIWQQGAPASAKAGFISPEAAQQTTVVENKANVAVIVGKSNEPILKVPVARGTGASGPKLNCRLYDVPKDLTSHAIDPADMLVSNPERGAQYNLMCLDESGKLAQPVSSITYDPANPASMFGEVAAPAQALALAMSEVHGAAPVVRTSPPKEARQIVGIPTWYWIDSWAPNAGSPAQAFDYEATIALTPRSLEVDPGDGTPIITCTAATAEVWDPSNEATACGHTYYRRSTDTSAPGSSNGRYVVRARLTYVVAYRITGPDGAVVDEATLDETVTSDWSTDPLTVNGYQAVIR